jgi:hypothetical protein
MQFSCSWMDYGSMAQRTLRHAHAAPAAAEDYDGTVPRSQACALLDHLAEPRAWDFRTEIRYETAGADHLHCTISISMNNGVWIWLQFQHHGAPPWTALDPFSARGSFCMLIEAGTFNGTLMHWVNTVVWMGSMLSRLIW